MDRLGADIKAVVSRVVGVPLESGTNRSPLDQALPWSSIELGPPGPTVILDPHHLILGPAVKLYVPEIL